MRSCLLPYLSIPPFIGGIRQDGTDRHAVRMVVSDLDLSFYAH